MDEWNKAIIEGQAMPGYRKTAHEGIEMMNCVADTTLKDLHLIWYLGIIARIKVIFPVLQVKKLRLKEITVNHT